MSFLGGNPVPNLLFYLFYIAHKTDSADKTTEKETSPVFKIYQKIFFFQFRNGLKALNCLYIYDENSVLNSATNRAKNLKNWIKDTEIALSAELGALRVSWEVYMSRYNIYLIDNSWFPETCL